MAAPDRQTGAHADGDWVGSSLPVRPWHTLWEIIWQVILEAFTLTEVPREGFYKIWAFTVSVYRATSSLLSVTSHLLVCVVWLAPDRWCHSCVPPCILKRESQAVCFAHYGVALAWSQQRGMGVTFPEKTVLRQAKGTPSICPFLSGLTSKFFLCQSGAIRAAKPNIFSMRDLDLKATLSWPNGPSHQLDMKWLGHGEGKFGKALCSKGTGMIYL